MGVLNPKSNESLIFLRKKILTEEKKHGADFGKVIGFLFIYFFSLTDKTTQHFQNF